MKKVIDTVWEYTKVIAGALILASTIRAVAYEPFKIPSSSMVPTLLIGDYLFVNKHVYGFRNPCTGERTEGESIKRGDVVVFEREKGVACGMLLGVGSLNFIKRVVAVPGDTIEYKNRKLYINNEELEVRENGEYKYFDQKLNRLEARHLIERINGVEHSILITENRPTFDVAAATVPEGHYVVLGDNRDNSKDSRYWEPRGKWGFVKSEEIVGRADVLFWSLGPKLSPRWERIGTSLRPSEVGAN